MSPSIQVSFFELRCPLAGWPARPLASVNNADLSVSSLSSHQGRPRYLQPQDHLRHPRLRCCHCRAGLDRCRHCRHRRLRRHVKNRRLWRGVVAVSRRWGRAGEQGGPTRRCGVLRAHRLGAENPEWSTIFLFLRYHGLQRAWLYNKLTSQNPLVYPLNGFSPFLSSARLSTSECY